MTPPARAAAAESRPERLLLVQVTGLLSDAADLGYPSGGPDIATGGPRTLTAAAKLLSELRSSVLSLAEDPAGPDTRQAAEIALRSLELSDTLRQRLSAQRTAAYSELRQGLDRLRRIANSAQLLDRVCPEIVAACGFERAILTRVEDGDWLPWLAHFPTDPDLEQRFSEWMNLQRFPASSLGRDLLELHPVLVADANADPRAFAPVIAFCSIRSYVAAPISPAGRLVGVFYADRPGSDRPLDELDRDLLWAFAEEFGRMYERVVLIERIRSQQSRIEKTFGFAETMMDSLSNAEIELARTPGGRLPGGIDEPDMAVPPPSEEISELLTSREAEVLALMVRGASNAAIAQQLIIKEGTVKSHVKHILRKLDAINRSEAISRYIGRTERRSGT